MSIYNIILKQNSQDNFDLEIAGGEKKMVIETWKQGSGGILSTTVFQEIQNHKLVPSANVYDLMHFALGLYTADQVVSRKTYGFQGWSRHFKLYVPVKSLKQWRAKKAELEKLLSFLSGDNWELFFRKKIAGTIDVVQVPTEKNPNKITTVALFSGGMDSFIGAIDLLETKKKVAFVSHYKRGVEGVVQSTLYQNLQDYYGKGAFLAHQFYVQPNHRYEGTSKEITSRARSFLFLCLGLTIANSLGDNVDLIVPENGLISLNVPLTGTRLSSHSTRTTHPYYMSVFNEVLSGLGVKNRIFNPYQFFTKGEMILKCKNYKFFTKWNSITVSCSHSERSRYYGLRPGIQCGYCVPCVIRQAAEKKGEIKGTEYVYDLSKEVPYATSKSGSDIRAFKLSLKKLEQKDDISIMFDILSSGPLPFKDKAQLQSYIDIYKRGMDEVSDFIN